MKTEEEVRAEIERLWDRWVSPEVPDVTVHRITYAIAALRWALGDYDERTLIKVLGIGD